MATTPARRHLPAHEADHDGAAAAMAFLWVLFAFKLVTVVLIFYHLQTFETGAILAATTWHWLPILGVLSAGPILFRLRLRRVRARRDQLRRAEWLLDPDPTPADRFRSRR